MYAKLIVCKKLYERLDACKFVNTFYTSASTFSIFWLEEKQQQSVTILGQTESKIFILF